MARIKAKLFLLAIFVVWAALLLATWRGWWQIFITLLAAVFKHPKLRRYRYALWIAQDQDVNVIFGGNPDITVSSKVGYMSARGSQTAKYMEKTIDWLFYIAVGQENHCAASIEAQEQHYEFR